VRARWWHEQQDEVVDGLLVKPQNQGQARTMWELSHEWSLAEATPSSRVSGGSPENHWVPWLIHKAKTKEAKTKVLLHRTSLTDVRRCSLENLKRRTCIGIARLSSRLSKFAVAGHPSDGVKTKTSKFSLEGHVSLII
jgi:hypothetical protein